MSGVPVVQGVTIDHLIKQIGYASSTITYVGLASPGTPTSAPRWQIKQLTLDSQGRTVSELFAGGSLDFVNIWDNRASLSYA